MLPIWKRAKKDCPMEYGEGRPMTLKIANEPSHPWCN